MAMSSSSGFEQWVYGIDRFRRGRHGKMGMRRDSSVQSDGIVLTMLLSLANGICAICSIPTKNIATRLGRTYRCTRTRRSRVSSRPSVSRWRYRFWADCTTNISERKFPTRTAPPILLFQARGSNNGPVDPLSGHQLSNPLTRVKHACLHRALRDASDLSNLIDRFLVVVD